MILKKESRRSLPNLATQLKRLIIDIQSLDDSEVARAVESNPSIPFESLGISLAFNKTKTRIVKYYHL